MNNDEKKETEIQMEDLKNNDAIIPPLSSEEEGENSGDFTLLVKCSSEIEAEMISTVLESGGIENYLLSQNDSSFPIVGNLSVIKIFVKIFQYEDAKAYLDDFYSEENSENG